MSARVSPETQLMIGMLNFIKNIVTIALGIVLGGYLMLQIAEHRAKETLTKFRENLQQNAPQNPKPQIHPRQMM